jgi:hypothetical protein
VILHILRRKAKIAFFSILVAALVWGCVLFLFVPPYFNPEFSHSLADAFVIAALLSPVALTPEQKSHEMNIPEALKTFPERAHSCTYDLLLDDSGNFLLRQVSAIPFVQAVDDSAVPVGLSANAAAQMGLDECRHLNNGGSWNLQWSCFSSVQ